MWGNPTYYLELVDSTQEEAKRLYKRGKLKDGTLVWAETQIRGKGRRGRKWFSPKGAGLWFTISFRPSLSSDKLQLINIASGVGVSSFLRGKGLDAKLKWPNDVLVRGKKICGILTEGIFNGDKLEFCLLGVGLNLRKSFGFPSGLRERITSFEEEAGYIPAVEKTLRDILNELYHSNQLLKSYPERILSEYRTLCETLGRKITFEKEGEILSGIAEDIDDRGRLIVRVEDSFEVLSSEMLLKVGE
ncbi:MAG: biotin--[acetyl-CoA-carboxylase] ligase [Synergistetes bacterium]|nr:biotin--[acetyl-CoA-carboxylase] ligase [Synergistota bacterium]